VYWKSNITTAYIRDVEVIHFVAVLSSDAVKQITTKMIGLLYMAVI